MAGDRAGRGGAAGRHSTPRPPQADRSRARLSRLPGGTRVTSPRPCPRSLAPVQRAPFHLKRQGLMTQRIGSEEERHATPNLETYFSSQSLILLQLSSSGGKAERETEWLLVSAPRRSAPPCVSRQAGWGQAGCPPGPVGRPRHPNPGSRSPVPWGPVSQRGRLPSAQPPGLIASPPSAELGDPAMASRPALCSWRRQQLSRPLKGKLPGDGLRSSPSVHCGCPRALCAGSPGCREDRRPPPRFWARGDRPSCRGGDAAGSQGLRWCQARGQTPMATPLRSGAIQPPKFFPAANADFRLKIAS